MLYKRKVVDYVLSQIGKKHIEIVNPFMVSLTNSGSLS